MTRRCERHAPVRFRMLTRLGERLRGIREGVAEGECAVLVPCCDIHTFGMKFPIDAAFFGASGTAVAVYRRVMPGRRIRHSEARLVVERAAASGVWFEVGDALFAMLVRAGEGASVEREAVEREADKQGLLNEGRKPERKGIHENVSHM